jgi:dinuclear metal center YbgI/SA1388 family protein
LTTSLVITVADICQFLEKLAPLHLAESWDNVGLLVGRAGRTVSTVITCLTLTEEVANEAIQNQAELVVTHHPVLFRATKRIDEHSAEGRILLKLIEAGIAVFSPHTAFDSAAEGINQQFAEALGLRGIQPLRTSTFENSLGAGRFGELDTPSGPTGFCKKITEILKATHLEISLASPHFSRIAIACGAAAEFLNDAIRNGCDTFITGEARFHAILESRAAGVNLILTGHYFSERPAVEQLSTRIKRQFPALNVFPSQKETNPTMIFVSESHGNLAD